MFQHTVDMLCFTHALLTASSTGVDVLLGGLLSAAARKKTSYRAAALAAMQKVLVALLPLTRTTTTAPAVVDGGAVWGTVSPPLLDALQQHLAAASAPAPAAKAEAAAGAAELADEVKPLPLPETCRWAPAPGAEHLATVLLRARNLVCTIPLCQLVEFGQCCRIVHAS